MLHRLNYPLIPFLLSRELISRAPAVTISIKLPRFKDSVSIPLALQRSNIGVRRLLRPLLFHAGDKSRPGFNLWGVRH